MEKSQYSFQTFSDDTSTVQNNHQVGEYMCGWDFSVFRKM